jgi:hypothetical protein
MDILLYNLHESHFQYHPYDELAKAFANFKFSNESYSTEGIIKKQTSGSCKYAEVKIIIENKNPDSGEQIFSWEVSNDKIPIEFMDVIMTTIKGIIKDYKKSLKFRIVGGSFHPVDSSAWSYEIATFRAIENLVNFSTS